MTHVGVGRSLRALRLRANRTQEEVAIAARIPRAAAGRIERGDLERIRVAQLTSYAGALEAGVSVVVRWRGGDIDRLVSARHSALHETMARLLAGCHGWMTEPEVSFAIYGERGVIDWLCFQPQTRSLLVIELKTEMTDVQAMLGQIDRYRRLAASIARSRGWMAESVSAWLVLADTRTNARHVARHRTILRTAYPDDGHAARRWIARPRGTLRAFSLMPYARDVNIGGRATPANGRRRARGPRTIHAIRP